MYVGITTLPYGSTSRSCKILVVMVKPQPLIDIQNDVSENVTNPRYIEPRGIISIYNMGGRQLNSYLPI